MVVVAVTTQQWHDCDGDGRRKGDAMATMATEMATATTASAMAGTTAATATPTEGVAVTATA